MLSTALSIAGAIAGFLLLAGIIALAARRMRAPRLEGATTQMRPVAGPGSVPVPSGNAGDAPVGPRLREISVAAWAARVISLAAPTTTIGRSLANNIVLAEDPVSVEHCRIEQQGTAFRLIDLGSTNKTWVNGRPVESVALRNGDQIRVGHTTFVFEAASGAHERPNT